MRNSWSWPDDLLSNRLRLQRSPSKQSHALKRRDYYISITFQTFKNGPQQTHNGKIYQFIRDIQQFLSNKTLSWTTANSMSRGLHPTCRARLILLHIQLTTWRTCTSKHDLKSLLSLWHISYKLPTQSPTHPSLMLLVKVNVVPVHAMKAQREQRYSATNS